MATTALHIVLVLVGLLLLYAGLFLSETEEGQLQNRLEEVWIHVDDLHSKAMTRQAALLRQVANLAADGFTSLFGRKLLSLKSVASCLCFCLASMFLSLALFIGEMPLFSKRARLICSLIFLICGFTKYFRYSGLAIIAFGIVLEIVGLKGDLKTYQASVAEVLLNSVVYAVAILTAICFISLIRWSLGLASRLSNALSLVAIIGANMVLGAALVWPLAYVHLRYRVSVFGSRGANPGPHSLAFLIFFYNVSVTNLFTALAAFSVLLVLLAALAHQLVWPAMSRIVYAAHRYGLIRQHKLLMALGASCLVVALPHNIVVRAVAQGVHLGN